MDITLYHNPNCSKSRKTLAILEENGASPNIVTYLSNPPSPTTIVGLAKLIKIPVADLLRKSEDDVVDAIDLPPFEDDEALAAWIHAHPNTLQRPIVVDTLNGKAVIGRPPENVLKLLSA